MQTTLTVVYVYSIHLALTVRDFKQRVSVVYIQVSNSQIERVTIIRKVLWVCRNPVQPVRMLARKNKAALKTASSCGANGVV